MGTSSEFEITIPRKRSDTVSAWILSLVLTLIVLVAAALSVINLIHFEAMIGSCLWLALTAILVFSGLGKEESESPLVVHWLGALLGKHFVRIVDGELHIGFACCLRRFFFRRISLGQIESIEWSTGQATCLAGRDMNDWHVVLWYDHRKPDRVLEMNKWRRKPDQELVIIGPSRERAMTEVLVLELVELLKQAGVALGRVEGEPRFIRISVTS